MPQTSSDKLIIDGDRLLRDLRLPYWTISILRQMHVGDGYDLFDFYGPPMGIGDDNLSNTGARIERIKGGLFLSAGWMLHVGKAHKRGHMLCLDTKLVLLPNRKFEVTHLGFSKEPVNLMGLRLFVRIVRLAHRLADMAKQAGAKEDARMMRPNIQNKAPDRFGFRIPFLDCIAAPPFNSKRSSP